MHKLKVLIVLIVVSKMYSYAQSPLIIAHRGASAYAPENTLTAFELAIEMNADMIETDVHQTKDSVLVIMHDYTVDRTTNGTGYIKDIASADFKQLEIAKSNLPAKEHPPTLEETLLQINGRKKLLIELKKGNDYYPRIEENVMQLIKKCNAEKWVYVIHSFDKEKGITSAKKKCNINLKSLIAFKLPLVSYNYTTASSMRNIDNWNGANMYYKFCCKRSVRRLQAANKTVFAWTVNNPHKVKRLLKCKVDGIITNKPDILKLRQCNPN